MEGIEEAAADAKGTHAAVVTCCHGATSRIQALASSQIENKGNNNNDDSDNGGGGGGGNDDDDEWQG